MAQVRRLGLEIHLDDRDGESGRKRVPHGTLKRHVGERHIDAAACEPERVLARATGDGEGPSAPRQKCMEIGEPGLWERKRLLLTVPRVPTLVISPCHACRRNAVPASAQALTDDQSRPRRRS